MAPRWQGGAQGYGKTARGECEVHDAPARDKCVLRIIRISRPGVRRASGSDCGSAGGCNGARVVGLVVRHHVVAGKLAACGDRRCDDHRASVIDNESGSRPRATVQMHARAWQAPQFRR